MLHFLPCFQAWLSATLLRCAGRLHAARVVLRVALLDVGLCIGLCMVGIAQAQEIKLDKVGHMRDITAQAQWWFDSTGRATIDDVMRPAGPARFVRQDGETMYQLQPATSLWVRLEMQVPQGTADEWTLLVPLPLIDTVSLYHQDSKNHWEVQRAGDRVAVADWFTRGRYPTFRLEMGPGKTTAYLKVEGTTPVTLPLEIGRSVYAQEVIQGGYLGIGMVMGVMLLLVVVCLTYGYVYRDYLYAFYAMYALILLFAICSYTGIAAQYFWDQSPVWADAAQGCLALVTAGFALIFINALTGVRRYSPRWSWALQFLGVMGPILAVVYWLVPRHIGVSILAVFMTTTCFAGLWVNGRGWARGDTVAMWVFLAFLPLAATVLLAIGRALGWAGVSWLVQYGIVVAMLVEVPMLMVALNLRSRERHSSQMREEAMAKHDALTGLLAAPYFQDRLQLSISRMARHKEDAAVMLIELVNYPHIAKALGATIAEQSLVRSVIKLRRVLRDVDTASRIDSHRFGVLLEGVDSRDMVTKVAARLIALGLMPLKGLAIDVTLQFHVSAVVLREHTSDNAPALMRLLKEGLEDMSPRTRRPIRFLGSVATQAMDLVAERGQPVVQDSSF